MAIINNLFLKRKTGKLANGVFYESKGQTIMRERVKGANPKSYAQCVARGRFGLGVLVYKTYSKWIKPFGATTKGEQSVYNMIVAVNAQQGYTFLPTKDEVESGNLSNLYLMRYYGTNGSLMYLESKAHSVNTSRYITCEQLKPGAISASTTLGQMSLALIGQNADIKEGDQLSFIGVNGSTPVAYEYTLNTTDTALVSTIFGGKLQVQSGELAMNDFENGFFVISRKTAKGIECSKSEYISAYPNEDNLKECATSYGWNGTEEIVDGGGEDVRVTITLTPKN